jgi:type IV pilus assembly protein PilV
MSKSVLLRRIIMNWDNKYKHFDHLRDKEDGFSLIEFMMAISIFAIGMLAIASMQITSIHGNTSARYQSYRSTIAQDKMEELMALNYSDTDISESGSPHADPSPPTGFSISWTVEDDNPSAGGKLVVVSVSSQGGKKITDLMSVIPDL